MNLPTTVTAADGFDFTPGRQLTVVTVSGDHYGPTGEGNFIYDIDPTDQGKPSYYLPAAEFPAYAGVVIGVFADGSGGSFRSRSTAPAIDGGATANKVTLLAPAGFTFSLTAGNGLFSGKLPHTDGTKPAYKGVILQKGANAGGSGWFLSTPPKLSFGGTGEAGRVELGAAP